MTQMRFYDAASGLLTPEAFSFMVTHLLRHAERTQEFMTLVVFVAERASRDAIDAVDEWVVTELGRLIRQAVRETDLLGRTRDGMLSLMLAGIDTDRARGRDRATERSSRTPRYGPWPANQCRGRVLPDARRARG